jgi:hypothetical protein
MTVTARAHALLTYRVQQGIKPSRVMRYVPSLHAPDKPDKREMINRMVDSVPKAGTQVAV